MKVFYYANALPAFESISNQALGFGFEFQGFGFGGFRFGRGGFRPTEQNMSRLEVLTIESTFSAHGD